MLRMENEQTVHDQKIDMEFFPIIPSRSTYSSGCAGLLTNSNLCCAIRMKNSDMKSKRFKAFKVRDQQQTFVKIKLFSSYSQDTAPHDMIGKFLLDLNDFRD